ncbi:MAG: asparagine synthase (glutamine-hydrolyzing), partial [Rhodospirillales bacterium]|nr:asparagine synthase (glutamine-hydrolyzing) [Rhodospirillales bacterium]
KTDHSDTEVLLHGYEQWGFPGLLERLQGMFGFAIWDEKTGKLFLARDRIGIKPVYFTKRSGDFLFASEIKSLFADGSARPEAAPAALYHYLTYLTTPAPMTMFDGVYKLPAGLFMEIDIRGKMKATRYWDAVPGKGIAPDETRNLSSSALEDFYTSAIRRHLGEAIEKRMMSDVPYGAFLSGGVDSSVNVALMSRFTDQPVNTFTVGFKDHQHLNELDEARRVAKLFKTNHHEVLVNEADMADYLGNLVQQQDEPLADWVCIPLFFVSKLAKDSGIKVVQVGEGSDEQFCGYNGYMKYLELHRRYYKPFQKFFPKPLQRSISGLAAGVARLWPAGELYADAVHRAAQEREPFWSGAIGFWESQKAPLLPGFSRQTPSGAEELIEAGLLPPSYLEPDSYQVAASYLEPFDQAYPGRDQLTRMIHNEFRLRLPELLLMRVDKITMANSLEARIPFLDHHLVDFTMDTPMEAKIRNGVTKHLLKKAVREIIPDDIIYRKKMGFSAPMAQWLRGDFGAQAKENILGSPLLEKMGFDKSHIGTMIDGHRGGRRDTSLPVWVLHNLTAWHGHWVGS